MATDHGELREQSGLYALGMLIGEERLAFESHLRSCPSCAAEVADARAAADALALAVPAVDPPPSLRARVLSSATGVPAREPARTSWRRSVPYGLAAAASIAAVALGLYVLTLRARVSVLEAQLRSARAAAGTLEGQLVSLRADAELGRSSAFILAAPDLRRVDLGGQAPATQASARAFWSPARGVVLAARGLPALPRDRVYQLWMVTETAPVSVALLPSTRSDGSIAVAPPPPVTGRVVALAVTLEPAGGVPAPTGPKVLVGVL